MQQPLFIAANFPRRQNVATTYKMPNGNDRWDILIPKPALGIAWEHAWLAPANSAPGTAVAV